MAVRSALKQSEEKCPEGPRWKRMDLLLHWKGGTQSRVVVKHLSPLQFHVWSAQDHTGDCPQKHKPQGSDSQDNQECRCLGAPHTIFHPNYIWGTPGGKNCGGGGWQSVDFLLDTEATFSVLTEAPDPLLLIHYHNGALWLSQMLLFPSSFNLQLGLCVVFWRVLIVPESPSPFLGRNILSKVQASVFMDMKFTLSLPLIE